MDCLPRFHDCFVVLHPREQAVLVLPAASGWVLPAWVHDAERGHTGRERDDPFWPAAIQREVRRSLGLETTVLDPGLYDWRDPATGDRFTAMVLEVHGPRATAWSPPSGSRWATHGELSDLPLVVPWQRRALDCWGGIGDDADDPRKKRGGGDTSPRPPWQRRGWFATAAAWTEAQLNRHGMAPIGAAEQLGTKLGRFLVRVPTQAAGCVYFKALPAMYAREPLLLRLLVQVQPERVVDLLAVDTDRHWLLMRDHGGVSLDAVRDLPTWEDALSAFGRLQVAMATSATWSQELAGTACPDLRLGALVDLAAALFADADVLLPGGASGVSGAEVEELRACLPRLRSCADRLRDCGVPDTLVHGDLLPNNVAVTSRGPLFLDWCEASLSHPFFSTVRFLASAEWDGRPVREQPEVTARLRAAYLDSWASYGSAEQLSRGFSLAQELQPLQHALTYQHLWHLLATETSAVRTWERRTVAARSLRRLLVQQAGRSPQ